MDGDTFEQDPPLPSLSYYANGDPLSANLSRLSLNTPSQTPLPESPATDNVSGGFAGHPDSRPASGPSRRSSGFKASGKGPGSPQLARKSSNSLLHRNGGQGTPPKPSPKRSPSYTQTIPSPAAEEPIQHTAASIAGTHFKKELALHNGPELKNPDTLVLIHDSCYGHRYSRPKTSKNTLNLIVERPERLQASVLGIASAYVRLGGTHAEGKFPPHPQWDPRGDIPFLIRKTTRAVPITSSAVTNVHGLKWMQELKAMCDVAEAKLAAGGKELTRPDTPSGPAAGKTKLHEGDLYLCKESLNAFEGALGGVLDGVDAVFRRDTTTKKAFVCIRPPGHHCSADLPSGFCWINNVHVGIEHAAQAYGLTHAAIIDFDLHHGDGSQSVTWDRNAKASRMTKSAPMSKKTSIGYFSLHDINSYPCEWGDKEKVQNASVCLEGAHGQNIWNVHLQPWTTENEFWELYRDHYIVLIEKARGYLCRQSQRIRQNFPNVEPRAAIFISAGFDASEYESEGMQRHGANVPTEFYARISAEISRLAEEIDTGCQGRVISVLEGGYSNRALTSGVMSHITGLVGNGRPVSSHGAMFVDNEEIISPVSNLTMHLGLVSIFENTWWNLRSLSQLEMLQNPPAAQQAPRKPRVTEPPTYTSPTQSFTAKVIDPSKVRSLSGALQATSQSRPPTPPPPDVDWATAAYELSKLLIPQDRQINSCKHEELAEPRFKRERVPSAGRVSAEPAPGEQMQLRGRRGRTPNRESDMFTPVHPALDGNRRRTFSNVPTPIEDDESPELPHSAGPSREQSTRPFTATSNAADETKFKRPPSVSTSATSRSRPSSRPTTAGTEMHVGRTRRSSGAKPDLMRAQSYTNGATSSKPPRKLGSVQDSSPTTSQPSGVSQALGGNTADSEVDNLTSGVKKITLRMGNSQALAENDPNKIEKPPSRTARKPPVPKAPPKPTSSRNSNVRTTKTAAKATPGTSSILSASDSSKPAGTATTDFAANSTAGASPSASKLSDSTLGAPSTASDINNQSNPPSHLGLKNEIAKEYASANVVSNDTTSDQPDHVLASQTSSSVPVSSEFIPYVPEGPPVHRLEEQLAQRELTWLPPNTSTPAGTPIKKTKDDLPVFTPQSRIPFAQAAAASNDEGSSGNKSEVINARNDTAGENAVATGEEYRVKSVWDVPDTPNA